jgi:hypothetical protein
MSNSKLNKLLYRVNSNSPEMKGSKCHVRVFFPVVRNLHNMESLALTIEITKKHKSKGGKINTHKIQSASHTRTQAKT